MKKERKREKEKERGRERKEGKVMKFNAPPVLK